MSKLAVLDDLLAHYYQLAYHTRPDILSRLQDVQAWQKVRMQRTHRAHFAEKTKPVDVRVFPEPSLRRR